VFLGHMRRERGQKVLCVLLLSVYAGKRGLKALCECVVFFSLDVFRGEDNRMLLGGLGCV
jgi:hypothetical protein